MPRNLNFCFTNLKLPSCPQPTLPLNHSRPLIKSFINSLYDAPPASSDHHSTSDSDSDIDTAPDLSAAFASQRFFFSSPGPSNSIMDSSTSSLASSSTSSSAFSNSTPLENDAVVESSITISTDSPDPYLDFRRSMQEMVEARELHDVRENWDYLHELLMCYLSLNPKSTHKFIVEAFADLVVSLTTSFSEKGHRRNPFFNDKL